MYTKSPLSYLRLAYIPCIICMLFYTKERHDLHISWCQTDTSYWYYEGITAYLWTWHCCLRSTVDWYKKPNYLTIIWWKIWIFSCSIYLVFFVAKRVSFVMFFFHYLILFISHDICLILYNTYMTKDMSNNILMRCYLVCPWCDLFSYFYILMPSGNTQLLNG